MCSIHLRFRMFMQKKGVIGGIENKKTGKKRLFRQIIHIFAHYKQLTQG